MTDLLARVAVITGGSTGIGRATARTLARHGMRVLPLPQLPPHQHRSSWLINTIMMSARWTRQPAVVATIRRIGRA